MNHTRNTHTMVHCDKHTTAQLLPKSVVSACAFVLFAAGSERVELL
jgi:hypothetical protein